jgi:hypothetical protein
MKKVFVFRIFALVLVVGFVASGCQTSPSNFPSAPAPASPATAISSGGGGVSSPRNPPHFNAVAEDGERYMFLNNQGYLLRYIIVQQETPRGIVWLLNVIHRIDKDFNIISARQLTMPVFNDNFFSRFFGVIQIRHVTNDVWEVDGELVRMIRAPEGFWQNAFLDLTV